MDKNISREFDFAVSDLIFKEVLKGHKEFGAVSEIDYNAPDLEKEVKRHGREELKNHEKYLKTATYLNASTIFPGKKGVIIEKGGSINEAFSQILIKGLFISNEYQKKLGVSIDYKKPSKIDKQHIGWQAAAQVLQIEKKIFKVTSQRREMIQDKNLFELLELGNVKRIKDNLDDLNEYSEKMKALNNEDKISDETAQTIDKAIRLVNPTSKRNKSKHSKRKRIIPLDTIISIPGVYNFKKSQINFQKYSLIINMLSKVLILNNKTFNEICIHPIIKFYKNLLPFTFEKIVNHWIKEAYEKSGEIFKKK